MVISRASSKTRGPLSLGRDKPHAETASTDIVQRPYLEHDSAVDYDERVMQPAITDEQIISLIPDCQRGKSTAMEALYDLYADPYQLDNLVVTGEPDPEMLAHFSAWLHALMTCEGEMCTQLERGKAAITE